MIPMHVLKAGIVLGLLATAGCSKLGAPELARFSDTGSTAASSENAASSSSQSPTAKEVEAQEILDRARSGNIEEALVELQVPGNTLATTVNITQVNIVIQTIIQNQVNLTALSNLQELKSELEEILSGLNDIDQAQLSAALQQLVQVNISILQALLNVTVSLQPSPPIVEQPPRPEVEYPPAPAPSSSLICKDPKNPGVHLEIVKSNFPQGVLIGNLQMNLSGWTWQVQLVGQGYWRSFYDSAGNFLGYDGSISFGLDSSQQASQDFLASISYVYGNSFSNLDMYLKFQSGPAGMTDYSYKLYSDKPAPGVYSLGSQGSFSCGQQQPNTSQPGGPAGGSEL